MRHLKHARPVRATTLSKHSLQQVPEGHTRVSSEEEVKEDSGEEEDDQP